MGVEVGVGVGRTEVEVGVGLGFEDGFTFGGEVGVGVWAIARLITSMPKPKTAIIRVTAKHFFNLFIFILIKNIFNKRLLVKLY